jgi:hypothetical protein
MSKNTIICNEPQDGKCKDENAIFSVHIHNINLYNCSCDYLYSFCVVSPLLCV